MGIIDEAENVVRRAQTRDEDEAIEDFLRDGYCQLPAELQAGWESYQAYYRAGMFGEPASARQEWRERAQETMAEWKTRFRQWRAEVEGYQGQSV